MRQKSQRNGGKDDSTTGLDSPLEERRNALFRNVVAPLFWLATVGFEDSEEVPLVPIRKKLRRQSTFADNDELQLFWQEKRTQPSFLSGGISNTEGFLNDLQKISGHIKRCQRTAKVTKPIRVAILDTGCKKDLDFFQKPERLSRNQGLEGLYHQDSDTETDSFGHGTFMARLLMHVAPMVDVYLIRVAENTDDLQNSEDSIAKVRVSNYLANALTA